MTSKELSNWCDEMCGNSNYISLDKHPELIDTVINHPDFSHITHRNTYSLTLYFYCEGSPTGVEAVAAIDIEKKDFILGKIDVITKALHCL